MASPLLRVHELSLAFDGQPAVLDSLSFTLSAGESLGLVGPSGSGKSLAASALLGFLPAGARVQGGTASYTDKRGHTADLLKLGERQLQQLRGREIGLIFQEVQLSLNPILRCGVQLQESVRQLRPEVTDVPAFLRELLEQVELGGAAARVLSARPAELSGGQVQRILIAMALVGQPRLLIADEPTTALDSVTEAEIVRLLDRLRKRLHMGVLFISHDESLLARATDRLLRVRPRTAPPARTAPVGSKPGPRALPAAPAVLEVDKLSIQYAGEEEPTVADCSFRLHRGEWLALVGPSGCGKTTIANWLVGLLPGADYLLRVEGREVAGHLRGRPFRKAVGAQMIFQDVAASLNPELTVGAAVREVSRLSGEERSADQLLASLGMDPKVYAGRYPHELSGGQRQRVAIARALAARPRILICDEAMSALDADLREEVQELLEGVCRERGIAILFITHDLRHVARHADNVLIMDGGRIVERGSAAAIMRAPASPMGRKMVRAAGLSPPDGPAGG